MKVNISRLVLFLTLLLPFYARARVEVLDGNSTYTSEELVGIKSGSEWFVINLSTQGYSVRKIKIKLVDSGNSELPGSKMVSVGNGDVFLVRGMELREGRVNSVDKKIPNLELGTKSVLGAGIKGTLTIGGKKIPYESSDNPILKEVIKDYALNFEVDGQTASIADKDEAPTRFGVIFLGDLNRDSLPDVYVDMDRSEKMGLRKLFMSEMKNGKFTLNLVAEQKSE